MDDSGAVGTDLEDVMTELTQSERNCIVELPDGYNGHTHKFYADPIAVDGNVVKLQSAEKPFLFAWKRKW